MKLYLLPTCLIMLLGLFVRVSADYVDSCTPFDAWVGGERFDYTIDARGNWNFPADTTLETTITMPQSGIWKYYSIQTDTTFIIIFRDFYASGTPAGQHHVCVYKLTGLGMSVN